MSYEDDLLDLEAATLRAAAGGWLGALDRIRTLFASKAPGLREAVFALVAPTIDDAALAGVARAFGLGLDFSLATLIPNAATRPTGADPDFATKAWIASLRAQIEAVGAPSSVRGVIEGLTVEAADALARARTLALVGADEATFLAPLMANRASTRRAIEFALNDASNAATEAVSDASGMPVVWVAERNACVHCLAYSGRWRSAADEFAAGLTYGARSPFTTTLRRPPLHPHCRCRLEILNAVEYAGALRREADRSVLRGWSLESESMATRVDAADRLLGSGVTAPKSVVAVARRAVSNREFGARGPRAAA